MQCVALCMGDDCGIVAHEELLTTNDDFVYLFSKAVLNFVSAKAPTEQEYVIQKCILT